MFGFSHKEILKLSVGEISSNVTPYTQTEAVAWISKALLGEPQIFEWQSKRKDGTVFWSEVNMRFAIIGGIERILVSVRDLSERQQIEEELYIEKEFSEKIIDTSNAIIVGLDKNHLIQIFNKGAEKITGYSKAEVIGKDWFQIFFPNEMLDEMNKVWKNAWGAPAHSYVNPILVKSGEERMISWQATGIYEGEDISKQMMISIGEDITESKRIEVKIKESEANLKAVIENRADSIWSLDKDLNFQVFNSFFAESYKVAYQTELKKGINALDILSPELHAFWESKYKAVLNGETIVFEFSEFFGGNNHVSLNPIIESKLVTGVSAISIEITAIKEAEKELQEHREHLEELVKERTLELEEKNEMLERVNRAFAGRELRMKELKEEIEKLRKS